MEVFWSEKFKIPTAMRDHYNLFMNAMSKRILQGHARYGLPDAEKKYATRMQKEVLAYLYTGNAEHLYNIANYAWLESLRPQHKKFHFDATVNSVTR